MEALKIRVEELGDEKIKELKAGDALPIEMARILSELKIFPSSFSKYGEAYRVSHSRAAASVRAACR